jgi:alpha-beta hydrolase superfamily lysophospholipase
VLWGISLGAATITRAVSEYDCKPEKVILELPFGSIEEAVQARLRMMHLPEEPLATLLTFWGGVENGFWAFDHKPGNYVKSITCPVLLQFGKNDIRVTEKEKEDLYKNITAPKRLVIYENSAHESLCKKENEKWVATVSAFLNQ